MKFKNKVIKSSDGVGFLGISSGVVQLVGEFSKDYGQWLVYIMLGCFIAYIIIKKKETKSNLPEIGPFFSLPSGDNYVIPVTQESELVQIVSLAEAHYKCPINRIDYKKGMWLKNKNCFFIVKDEQGRVKANINLLPLKYDAYYRLREGAILESQLTPDDIYSPDEKSEIKYVYVEGLLSRSADGDNSDKISVILLAMNFSKFIRTLAGNPETCIICAIGGSKEGDNLMTNLGLYIAKQSDKRQDKLHFFEADFKTINSMLNKKTVIGVLNRVIKSGSTAVNKVV